MTNARHTVFDTNPSGRIVNSQPPGIGRINNLDDLWVVNNLGRDVTVFSVINGVMHKHAVFDETAYPNQDLESQFDLDMHALVADPFKNLWTVNHFGLVRVFAGPFCDLPQTKSIRPLFSLSWPGDVEKAILAWPYFVSTSPLGYSTDGRRRAGFLVSESVEAITRQLSERNSDTDKSPQPLDYRVFCEDWGVISTMAISGESVAIAAGRRIGLLAISDDNGVASVGPLSWEIEVPFQTAWLEFHEDRLLCAGYNLGSAEIDDPDWHLLSGGGFCIVDIATGAISRSELLEQDLAWGNGAETICLVSSANQLLGVDRQGGLHLWDLHSAKRETIQAASEPLLSKGLAHIKVVDRTVLAGFNRDGYRIHMYQLGD
ncbi:MAG: hypothetical protein K2Z81_08475 [Cyanobacteria bacterium]|nr:hypothetical protein [Cyanobacteriota bacterium]